MKVPLGMTLVVGLGVSGGAIARHLAERNVPFMLADTRPSPPGLASFRVDHPDVPVYCGPLSELDMSEAGEIVLSPGVDPRMPELAAAARSRHAQGHGIPVIGEIELFVRECCVPIAAITGSNAKSTVTTLLGEMARAAGRRVAVGGNLGPPALDLLHEHPDAELFVLEVSSFQLETTVWLGAETAAYLNLCEDHLDRHGDMANYGSIKQSIFRGARHAVVNGEDERTWPVMDVPALDRFTTQEPVDEEWGISELEGETWLMHGGKPLIRTTDMGLRGRHNQANALAALAMGQHLGLPLRAMRQALARFPGLPHRGEWVADLDGVSWINDSKGTNVGATLAAIHGLGPTIPGKLVLLAGGVGKDADFTPLAQPLATYARAAVLFGQDAERLAQALPSFLAISRVSDLEQAMAHARSIAEPGDCVLLSPACASLDQFTGYQARGEVFCRWVRSSAGEASCEDR
ncbi:UDP-N-acetylmuramoyl-L-alanine--D-glutamate ligase [Aidingimonas halophila]|uniref:UDP-N-acetylmuramoylalanine--D-glutamate ligase n=1 Tax=Aidingimonas halophila TaxID=574349 RepID=A0A1H2QSB8_9GAMM|nr:UDP-N-acetylmuramoyl-L-alanine--D-glutamate ligase [Aidingimonas halophila]GHC20302.1 UDP-N-acetylmuramoylalanine--D-glutamate ligase [Aidingimonas halophila]SDW10031.1 UDP-N-acetylmuramoylalanine--D-glutamate ligase [Aidingimonas halophila]